MGKSKQWLLDEIGASFVPSPHGSRMAEKDAKPGEPMPLTPDQFAAVVVATLQIAEDGGLSIEAQIDVLGKITAAMRESLTR